MRVRGREWYVPAAAGVLLAVFGSGCALFQPPLRADPARLPVRIEADFSSELPRHYVVLSGPAASYKRFPVNDLFQGALVKLVRAKSSEESQQVASIHVLLKSMKTSFSEIGAGTAPPIEGRRYASLLSAPTRTDRSLFAPTRAAWDEMEDGSIPYEIRKRVTLALHVVLLLPNGQLHPEDLQVDHTEVIPRERYEGAWSYDYASTIDGAIAEAVAAIDGLLDRALGPLVHSR